MNNLLKKGAIIATFLLTVGLVQTTMAQTQITIKKPMSEADYKEVQQILTGVDSKSFLLKANVANASGTAKLMNAGASKVEFSKVSQTKTGQVGQGATKASSDNFIVVVYNKVKGKDAFEAAKLQRLQAIAAKYQ
jgi:hypothetical protein